MNTPLLISGIIGVVSAMVCFYYAVTRCNTFRAIFVMSGMTNLYFGLVWGLGGLGVLEMETRGALGVYASWLLLLNPVWFAMALWKYRRYKNGD